MNHFPFKRDFYPLQRYQRTERQRLIQEELF